jgi:hypothetical protein
LGNKRHGMDNVLPYRLLAQCLWKRITSPKVG